MSKVVLIEKRIFWKGTDFKKKTKALLNDHDAQYFEKKGWGVIQPEPVKDKDEKEWNSLSDLI